MSRQLRRSMAGSGVGAPPRRAMPRPMLRADLGRRGRGITQFLSEVRSELRKVVWPTRREAMHLTALVIGMSVAVGVLLGIIDYAFSSLFQALVR